MRRLRAAGCVFAEDEAAVLLASAIDADELERLTARRVRGEPLEHIVGWVQFCGLRVDLDPGVFIPRRRTEYLAQRAADSAAAMGTPVVIDLCCGCGAVGLAVARRVSGVQLHAVDVDPVAVACARRNLAAVGGRVYVGNLDEPLPPELRGHVDVLVANVPYVPTSALALMPAESREHEPRATHDGGADGLDVARSVIALAPRWLAPAGAVLIETSDDQAEALAAVMAAAGLDAEIDYSDDDSGAVIVIGRRAITAV